MKACTRHRVMERSRGRRVFQSQRLKMVIATATISIHSSSGGSSTIRVRLCIARGVLESSMSAASSNTIQWLCLRCEGLGLPVSHGVDQDELFARMALEFQTGKAQRSQCQWPVTHTPRVFLSGTHTHRERACAYSHKNRGQERKMLQENVGNWERECKYQSRKDGVYSRPFSLLLLLKGWPRWTKKTLLRLKTGTITCFPFTVFLLSDRARLRRDRVFRAGHLGELGKRT